MFRSLLAMCWAVFAALTIVAAVVITVARLLLPYVDSYQEKITAEVAEAIGQNITVGDMAAEWRGLGPYLILQNVRLLDRQGGQPLIVFKETRIGIDLVASLVRGQLTFGSLIISDVNITIVRHQDGAITVEGFDTAQQGEMKGAANTTILEWLTSQSRLAIEDGNVTWHDSKQNGEDLRFSNVSIQLKNAGNRHQLDGSATLPLSLGRRIAFALDIEGDLLQPGGWGGRGYVNGGGLQLANWLKGQPAVDVGVMNGIAEIKLWTTWKNARLENVDGTVSALGIEFSADTRQAENDPVEGAISERSLNIDSFGGDFSWQSREDGWQLAVSDLMLGRQGVFWPRSSISIAVTNNTGSPAVIARASYLRIDDLRDVLLASKIKDDRVEENLAAIYPGGVLSAFEFRYASGIAGENVKYLLRGRFDDLTTRVKGGIPGITGVDGTMSISEQGGVIDLDTRNAELDFGTLFRDHLALSVFGSRILMHNDVDAWRIRANDIAIKNDDLRLRANLALDVPHDGGSPTLNLLASFDSHSVEHTSRYLPVGVMPPASVKWLDKAIVSGAVPYGGMVYRGKFSDFPFDHGQGVFEVSFAVNRGILDFAEAWPRLEEVESEVSFRGRGLEIAVMSAKSLGADIRGGRVIINNFKAQPALLEVDVNAAGDTVMALEYLRQSPLNSRFSVLTSGVTATGRSQLALQIKKPLSMDPPQVAGKFTFEHSGIVLADGDVDLMDIDGAMMFTDTTLSAEDIKAKILGIDSTVAIETTGEQTQRETTLKAQGIVGAEKIAKLVKMPLLSHLEGQTPWQASLHIPVGNEGPVHSRLRIESDLTGIAVDLPAPLTKSADQAVQLAVELGFPRSSDLPLRLQYGQLMSGTLALGERMKLERGELRFGGEAAVLPDQPGLRIAGKAGRFSFSEWLGLDDAGFQQADGDSPTGIRWLDVQLDSLEVYQRDIHHADIRAERKPEGWDAQVKSDELSGKLTIPLSMEFPLVMELEHLKLAKLPASAGGQQQLTPRNLPSARITAQRFVYGDIDFGNLKLVATRHPAGLRLETLALSSPLMSTDARGEWLEVNAEQYSSFNIAFSFTDLGNVLNQFGYSGTVKDGKGQFDIVARWPGPPTAFALEQLNGNMHLRVEDGRLLDLDPGAGRIFGLISLQALPRRLTLDFSDLFKKGFTFDRIEGDYVVKNGDATTSNLYLDGPAARIDADGKIALAKREYDQRVTVTPHVTSSLPFAGAVVGGVGIGAAILLVQKLFEPEVDKITRIRYSVTGPWDNPLVKQIDKEKDTGSKQANDDGQ